MKAIVIQQPGGPEVLHLRDLPRPQPAAGQVLVRVQAAGVNRPDVLMRQGKYAGSGDVAGLVPGLELAGVVEECGPGTPRWQPGDAVCALVAAGGYAEYAAVDARHCLPLPTGLSMVEAAALPETVFTVWHNVFQRGHLQPSETLLVHGGSGGIGTTAIQLARALGSRVATTAGDAAKCQACRDLGAEWAINYKDDDFEEVLKPVGVDVVLDMIGGDYIPKNLRLLHDDGRLVFINAMRGAQGEFNAMQVMSRRLARNHIHSVAQCVSAGLLAARRNAAGARRQQRHRHHGHSAGADAGQPRGRHGRRRGQVPGLPRPRRGVGH